MGLYVWSTGWEWTGYSKTNIYINRSLKFEIKAKQFYAASQRVL